MSTGSRFAEVGGGAASALLVFSLVAAGGATGLLAQTSDSLQSNWHLPTAAEVRANTEPNYLRGWQLYGQGKFDEAISSFKAAITVRPGLATAYELLAQAYYFTHRDSEGEAYFRALAARPAANALAHLGLARIAGHRDRQDEREAEMAECVRLDPRQYNCALELGGLRFRSGSEGATLGQFRRAVAFDPSLAESHVALGGVLIDTARFVEAVAEGETAVTMAEASGDRALVAQAEFYLGSAILGSGADVGKALMHSDRACTLAAQLDDPVTLFRICGAAASAAAFDRPRSGHWIEEMGDLASLARDLEDPDDEAGMEGTIAMKLAEQGTLDQAIAHFSRAADLLRVEGLESNLSGLLMNFAQAQMQNGDSSGAFSSFEEAVQAARKARQPVAEAYVFSKLTVAQSQAGQALEAIESAREAIRLFKETGFERQAGAELGDIALAYLSLGDQATASHYIEDSLAAAHRYQDEMEQARLGILLGDSLLLADEPGKAKAALEHALELIPRQHTPKFEVRARTLLAESLSLLGENAAAEREFEHALVLANQLGDTWLKADLLERQGQHFLREGKPEAARKAFGESLELADRAALPNLAVEAHHGLAEVALARGQAREALPHLEGAVHNLESLRSSAPSPDSRSGLLQRNWQVYEDLIYALSLLDRQAPGSGYDRAALTYAERGRARVLLELLEESRAGVTLGLSAEQAARQTALERKLTAALDTLRRDQSARALQAADDAERTLAEWTTELRSVNPRFRDLKYPEPLDADGIGRLSAKTGVTIVEYSVGKRGSRVWVAAADGSIRSAALPSQATIAREVEALRAAIARRPTAATADAFRSPAAALYKMLIEPILPRLSLGAKLLVIPDGILHYLPFECLVDEQGRFLIQRASITYAPSASVFARLIEGGAPSRPQLELLAVGNPVMGTGARTGGGERGGEAEVVRGVYAAAGMNLQPLPGTAREVRTIAALFRHDQEHVLLGSAATVDAVKSERLDDFRRVHLATHALIDERMPIRSGLVLGSGAPGGGYGVLRLDEIMNLRLDSDLVTLSACQTGLGELVRGEGMVGLTRAFLFAGARRLAVSLWPVNDDSTPDFMREFYRRMRSGASPSDALREAKLAMLKSDTVSYRHPYFWAPFVLMGAR